MWKTWCEKCGKPLDWPGLPDKHPLPILCDPCDKAESARLKRTQRVDCYPRSEAQKKREPF